MCTQFTEDSREMLESGNIKTVSGAATAESSSFRRRKSHKNKVLLLISASVIFSICIGYLWCCLCAATVGCRDIA
jgi:hypothetical protein